jgi:SPP1 gp7 family putative phage head morphogenesis protein
MPVAVAYQPTPEYEIGGIDIYTRINRYDPTNTTTLRNGFSRAMGVRFRKLRGEIRKVILEDRFGFGQRPAEIATQAFGFATSGEKVDAFMDWLRDQQTLTILEAPHFGRAIREPWTNMYIESTYQKGIARSRSEMISSGYPVPGLEETGGLAVAFNQPVHADRVGLLYTRTYNDLKGITDTMDGQISRVLSQAMADGKNPRDIAQLLTRTISGPVGDLSLTDTLGRFIPAERRARMLARTEIIRAHHVATIQEYRNWELEGVRVRAEWKTAGYGVCEECAALEGQVFSLDEIESMIPLHPNCRCVALPVDMEEER